MDENTLNRWARRGEIPAQRVDDQYRFEQVDLLEFASARGLAVQPDVPPERAGEQLPRLADAVRAGGVHHDVPASDKPSALRAVVDRLPVPDGIDRSFLVQMLLAREQLGSTGFGHGIALPHPRYPIVLRVGEPSVSVCYLANPVPFDALDGQPVHTLVTVVSPSVRVHLHVLALLGAALRDGGVLGCIERRAGEAELVAALEQVEAALTARRKEQR